MIHTLAAGCVVHTGVTEVQARPGLYGEWTAIRNGEKRLGRATTAHHRFNADRLTNVQIYFKNLEAISSRELPVKFLNIANRW